MTVLVAAVLIGLQTAAVGVVALRIGRWTLASSDSVALRVTAVLTAAFGQVVLVATLLGAVGLFRRWPIALAHLLLAGVVLVRWRDVRSDQPSDAAAAPQTGWVAASLATVLGAAFALYYLIGFRGTTREYDTLNYKVPNLAHMMLRHDTWSLAFANIGYFTNLYPSNHVLLAGFFALPFGTDGPSYLVNVAVLVLLIAGVGALAEAAGGSAIAGAALGAAVTMTPIALQTQAGSLQDDLAAAAGVVAGAALVLASRSARSPLRLALLGGVALGLGVGTKYTAVLPAVAVMLLGIVVAPQLIRLKVAALLAVGTVSTSAFWLVRNLFQMDNPVSPLDVGPLKGVDSPLRFYETSLLSHVVHFRTGPLRTWLSLGWRSLGVAAIVVLAGAVVVLLRGRRQPVAAGLAAVALFSVVSYLATPYTGGGPDGVEFLIGSQLRYAFPALALAAGAAAAFLDRRVALATAGASLLYAVWRIQERDPARPDVYLGGRWALVAIAAVVAAGAVVWLARRPLSVPEALRRAAPLGAALAVTAAAGLAVTATPRASSTLDATLARLGAPRGPVAVVDVRDVRALLGPCLKTAIVGPKLGRFGAPAPPATAALDRAINALDVPALAVGQNRGPTVPADWTGPPGWTKVASDRGIDLYAPPGRTPIPGREPEKASALCAVRKVP